jgi:hypothetical protein
LHRPSIFSLFQFFDHEGRRFHVMGRTARRIATHSILGLALISSAAVGPAHAVPGYDPKAVIAALDALRGEFMSCIEQQTVKLGASNSESVETITRAVRSVCTAAEGNLRAAFAETPFDRWRIESLIRQDREQAEDNGIAALLRVRASGAVKP